MSNNVEQYVNCVGLLQVEFVFEINVFFEQFKGILKSWVPFRIEKID